MKLFITGDTHRRLDKVMKVFEHLKGVDAIIHTGDFLSDAKILKENTNLPVISVPGNCDGSLNQNDFEIFKTEYGNILVTHGHMHNVKYSLDRLLYLCEENNCIAAVFGHTHIPLYDEIDGIHLINPGSLSRPRDGSQGSYAIATITKSTFAASIVYYNDDLFGNKPVKGGHIKNLLNYSDRF